MSPTFKIILSENIYRNEIFLLAESKIFEKPLVGDFLETQITNPLCGDSVVLAVKISERKISEVQIIAEGCLICRASANLMVSNLIGMPTSILVNGVVMVENFMADENHDLMKLFPNMKMLADFRQYKARLKCVLLPWMALNKLAHPPYFL